MSDLTPIEDTWRGQPRWICPVCGRDFMERGKMDDHLAYLHTPDVPHTQPDLDVRVPAIHLLPPEPAKRKGAK